MCAKAYVGERSVLGLLFINVFALFLVNLEFTDLTKLAGQPSPGILLCSPPHC